MARSCFENDSTLQLLSIATTATESNRHFFEAISSNVPLVHWRPPKGRFSYDNATYWGFGIAAQVSAKGTGQIDSICEQSKNVFQTLTDVSLDYIGPKFFGAIPFTEASNLSARFWIPRWCLMQLGSQLQLRLTISREDFEQDIRLSEEVQKLDSGVYVQAPLVSWTKAYEEGVDSWIKMILSAKDQIKNEKLSKVVLSRCIRCIYEKQITAYSVIKNLRHQHKSSTVFLIQTGQDAFLGASPERLVEKDKSHLLTEALAGTYFSQKDENDLKNIQEHQWVVDWIVQSLLEHGVSSCHVGKLETRSLQYVTHLATPIEATVDPQNHVLEWVALLHPTPAVGGVPQKKAIDFICNHEKHQRGYYAGPVGWFDAHGNGSFCVGIRSAQIQQNQVILYAGAGIVRDSDPIEEWRETEHKFAAMRNALTPIKAQALQLSNERLEQA